MPPGLRAIVACVLGTLGLAIGLAACGGGKSSAVKSGSDTLTIYSSLPLQGPDRNRARDMVNAIKLALQQAGGKVGPFSVTYVSLDSATREAGTWTGDKVLANARQAVRDINAIAYIGDRDSAATALSLPLTNEGGILQVSPSSTYDGLTRTSRRQGEPERFYPSGERTFGRVVPADHVQASALIGYMKSAGVHTLALLADREIYGGGIADEVHKAAGRQGIEVFDRGRIDASKDDLSGPRGASRRPAPTRSCSPARRIPGRPGSSARSPRRRRRCSSSAPPPSPIRSSPARCRRRSSGGCASRRRRSRRGCCRPARARFATASA